MGEGERARERKSRRSSPEQTATQHKHEMASMMRSVARKTVALRAVRNGSRVCMMQVLKKELRYECLSYLPPLTDKQIGAQVDYITNNGWTPCIEFAEPENSFAKEDLA